MNKKHDETSHEDIDDRRIRELDRLWGDAASRKDLAAVLAFYADNASLVWPNTQPVHGRMQVGDMWKQMLQTTQGLKLEFRPETIIFSPDRMFATDYGVVIFDQMTNSYTFTRQEAKYLVVWTKVGDSWKVLYDCYNLNA